MAMEKYNEHLTREELIEYIDQKLGAAGRGRVETHFARCAECTQAAQEIHLFNAAWQTWTATAHGTLYLQVRLNEALKAAAAQPQNAAWKAHLEQWRTSWAGKARAAVNIITGEAAKILADGLEALTAPGEAWEFELAPQVLRSRGSEKHRSRGEEHRSKMQQEKIKSEKVELSPQQRIVKLTLERAGDVTVRAINFSRQEENPFVLLFTKEEKLVAYAKELKREKGSTHFAAKFANVSPGVYLAAFKPLRA